MNSKWTESLIKLNNKEFKIYHNLPDEINAALQNWLPRTKRYTPKSFCDYINHKRLQGKTDHIAYTEEEYNNIIKDGK